MIVLEYTPHRSVLIWKGITLLHKDVPPGLGLNGVNLSTIRIVPPGLGFKLAKLSTISLRNSGLNSLPKSKPESGLLLKLLTFSGINEGTCKTRAFPDIESEIKVQASIRQVCEQVRSSEIKNKEPETRKL